MLSTSQKLTYTGLDNDVFESPAHRNLIDVTDYYRRKADTDTYASLKPSLRPLKVKKNKREDNERESELEALAAQKKIVYIKTFNHVKNEAIVEHYENKVLKSAQNFSDPLIQHNEKHNSKKKDQNKIDYSLSLSIFKKNKEKFNPSVKPQKKKQSMGDFKLDDSSTFKEFEFLTGVNIQGAEQEDPEEEEDNEDPSPNLADGIDQKMLDSKRYKIPSEGQIEEQNRESESLKSMKEQTNLPVLKKNNIASNEKTGISVSEARYKKYLEKKPKIYISFKTNSVQPFGRPANYQDHLVRVYNKESTPSAQYPLINHLPAKKDMKKMILDCYLSQYNLEALKDIDESLYEYAKQQSAT